MEPYFQLGRLYDAPVRLHWMTPVGIALVTGFKWVPGAWTALFLLIFVHEVGHAALVRRFGGQVVSIEVLGIGGLCRWTGDVTWFQRALIAWGGVFAQALAGLTVVTLYMLAKPPPSRFAADLYVGFTWSNLVVALANLVPVAPLDGHQAWKAVPVAARRLRARFLKWRAVRRRRAEAVALARAQDDLEKKVLSGELPAELDDALARLTREKKNRASGK